MDHRSRRFRSVLGAAWFVCVSSPVGATWQDDIGYTQLATELGPALPKGTGVAVTQVEGTASDDGEYRASDSASPTSGNFAGKSFVFRSGPPDTVSGHAAKVGAFMYGVNADARLGDASVAPLAGTGPTGRVTSHEAGEWMTTGFLRWSATISDNPLLPRSESSTVANHSWISLVGSDVTGPQANEVLRRLDYSVRSSDYVAAVGVNNGAANPVPAVLASAYNVLAVGLTNGGHSSGVTPADVDGAGRTKPELVAPLSAASWATAVVSSCTALLQERAAAFTPASVAADAQRSVVLRSVLLAGASKAPFQTPGGALNWANSTTRPLDLHFGAGEVNVRRSYRSLDGGRSAPSASRLAPSSGWHYEPALPPAGERAYFFLVPSGFVAREVSAALVWDRRIILPNSGVWNAPTPQLANLDLHLHDSTGFVPGVERALSASGANGSVPHPLEHIYARDLPAGEYALRVTSAGPSTTDYSLAWLTVLEPAQPPSLAAAFAADGSTLLLTFSHLSIGLTYVVETSSDLGGWTSAHTFVATGTTASWTTAASGRGFFRLVSMP